MNRPSGGLSQEQPLPLPMVQMFFMDGFWSPAQLSGFSTSTAAINALVRMFFQDDLHSRVICSSVQHVTNFLKTAGLKINAWIYLQNTENANTNKSHIQGTRSNQTPSR